jgi:hypothetical protein
VLGYKYLFVHRREEAEKWREEHAKEREAAERVRVARELHAKARSNMTVKYFLEKVAPAVHEAGAKKEVFGEWKWLFLHDAYGVF